MQPGHANFSFEPLSVSASPPSAAPALEPLSPLSDLSPSPPLPSNVHCPRTRLASGSTGRPSQRRRDAAELVAPSPATATPVRRIRPLACMTANTNANAISPGANAQTQNGREKPWKADAWRVGGTQQQQQQAKVQQIIEFPPKHVVLHPDDANNKVFLAMGRALMSISNCAMTIKDLAELCMQHGLVCQNVSAASQAITFFIRSHLNRCEEENDFPLLLRHVLSGTPRDDALAPALYSRTGGNVSNKDKTARDENGNLKERITCFRRGTTVWYLSKAAGAPCPFARAGIALRDYAEGSSITNVEGRKGDCDLSRGIKRKRERTLRRRAGSGPAARRDSDDSDEGEKPPKIKLTLRLRPCLTSSREKTQVEAEESSSSSSSDSDSDSQDDPMDVDTSPRPTAPSATESSARKRDSTWTFPPFPIQRRISIPPYTPSEEIYPTIYTSPTTNFSSSTFFSEWSASTKPLVCVDPPTGSTSYYNRGRAASVFSVASPPPESDDEFELDDEDDDVSFSMSPKNGIKREDELQYVFPQAAPSTSSFDLGHIKSEPFADDFNDVGCSKRSSTHTIKQEKQEDLDLDMASLSLSFPEDFAGDSYGSMVKHEDDDFLGLSEGFSWRQPVDLTQDESVPICESASRAEPSADVALAHLWKNVELLGPETVRLQDLEGCWDEVPTSQSNEAPSPSRRHVQIPVEERDEDAAPVTASHFPVGTSASPTFGPPGSPMFSLGSLSPPPSLDGSVHGWSALSPDTEIDSVGPASPPSFVGPEPQAIVRSDESSASPQDSYDVPRSFPWMIQGKPASSSEPSRQAIAVRSDDILIPLSEHSTPWERGMYTEEDVEKHLLEPPRALAMMSIRLPSSSDVFSENAPLAPEPPLSPQEEAVFQSLCICPDMSWEDEAQTNAVKEETEKVLEVQAPRVPDTTLGNVFAVATRPSMRLRERRPSKRLTEVEQARKQTEGSRYGATKEDIDANADSDADADPSSDIALRRRGKDVNIQNNTDSGNANKGPLRRSKRVANAVAMQRNRERLRKRTVS